MNEKAQSPEKCPLCGGRIEPGVTTFTAELGFGVVVVRKVPAAVCTACGESWFEDEVARAVERIVEQARRERRQVEVLSYQP